MLNDRVEKADSMKKRINSPTISPKSACFMTKGMNVHTNWISAREASNVSA